MNECRLAGCALHFDCTFSQEEKSANFASLVVALFSLARGFNPVTCSWYVLTLSICKGQLALQELEAKTGACVVEYGIDYRVYIDM